MQHRSYCRWTEMLYYYSVIPPGNKDFVERTIFYTDLLADVTNTEGFNMIKPFSLHFII